MAGRPNRRQPRERDQVDVAFQREVDLVKALRVRGDKWLPGEGAAAMQAATAALRQVRESRTAAARSRAAAS